VADETAVAIDARFVLVRVAVEDAVEVAVSLRAVNLPLSMMELALKVEKMTLPMKRFLVTLKKE
jgi:hypothetical protein